MSAVKKILHELNYLKWEDIGQVFLFVLSLPVALVYKVCLLFSKRPIWLVCEDRNEARDNGFCFFKYLNAQHPEICSYYAISPRSGDLDAVRKTGKTVRYGSLWHWVLYLCCEYNISSQKAGKPNAAVCYVLEVYGLIKSKSVFLQHGITLSDAKWLYYQNTKMRLFVCGAKPEYDYVRERFGYPDDAIAYVGFCRFDDYHAVTPTHKQVVLMPSWREWIASKNEFSSAYEDTSDFKNTEYYQKYQSLLSSPALAQVLEKHDLTLYFYPHRNMQKYITSFSTSCERIRIVDNKRINIRDLLMQSAVMITDYSSVALDFAYMKKPVIYYQFDEQRFREAQYAEGYFRYREAGLGTVVRQEDEVVSLLDILYQNGLTPSSEFEAAHRAFFPLCDTHNNERTFDAICQLR